MAISGLTDKISNALYGLTAEKSKKPESKRLAKPTRKSGEYTEKRKEQLEAYLNREPYNFNLNTDRLYKQYADQYKRQGEAAMRDTVARAAEKTGGYGSSYGVTAAAQAYQGYLDKLNDAVPEIEATAYDRYSDNAEKEKEKLDSLTQLANEEYRDHRDDIEDYKELRDYYRKVYEYNSDAELDMYKALTDYVLGIAKLENSDYHDYNDWLLAMAKLNS